MFTDLDVIKRGIVTVNIVLVTPTKLGLDAGMMEIEKNPKPAKDVQEVQSKEKVLQNLVTMMRKRNQTPKLVVDP